MSVSSPDARVITAKAQPFPISPCKDAREVPKQGVVRARAICDRLVDLKHEYPRT